MQFRTGRPEQSLKPMPSPTHACHHAGIEAKWRALQLSIQSKAKV